jgi:ubiquinol-cytochrome c reductase cytochrome b subunit
VEVVTTNKRKFVFPTFGAGSTKSLPSKTAKVGELSDSSDRIFNAPSDKSSDDKKPVPVPEIPATKGNSLLSSSSSSTNSATGVDTTSTTDFTSSNHPIPDLRTNAAPLHSSKNDQDDKKLRQRINSSEPSNATSISNMGRSTTNNPDKNRT